MDFQLKFPIATDFVTAAKGCRIFVYLFHEMIAHLKTMPFNMNGKNDRIELKKMYEAEEGK